MAEQQEQDFSKLSLEEKLTHKVWKARLQGYEEAAKLFKMLDDESHSDYGKYAGMMKKFVVESNAFAQEKAVDATLVFVENASIKYAERVCESVVAGVVAKCLNGRPKTKEAGINVCLMLMEAEQQAVVQEEITKGLANKQPKIVTGCIQVLRTGLNEFGAKVMNVKQLMKAMPDMFVHSDKNVRAEAKSLAVEVYRWIGAAMKPSLEKHLKPVQMKELEDEWAKLPGDPAVPLRVLRSQQQSQAAAVVTSGGGGGDSVGGGATGGVAVVEALDPFELFEPVDMLSQMPKDFFEKVAAVKWSERKEALEAILPLAQSPRLLPGEYAELMKALKKIICKDSNVMVVVVAGNVVSGLAKGLRKSFQNYAAVTMAGIFEKFKEKKLNVVNSLREAADAVFLTTTIGGIQDECIEALNHKNPCVKSETLLFLSRCFLQCTPPLLPKPMLKAFCPVIVQRLDDTTPQVREAAFETIAILLKVVGDRPMNAYLDSIDKTKMAKIQEQREKVELKIQTGLVTSPAHRPPPAATAKPRQGGGDVDVSSDVKKKPPPKKRIEVEEDAAKGDGDTSFDEAPVKRKPVRPKKKEEEKAVVEVVAEKPKQPVAAPAAPKKKTGAAKPGGKGKAKGKDGWMEPSEPPEPAIAAEEVDEKAAGVLPSGLLAQLADANWKERLAACEKFQEFVNGLPPDEMQSHLFVKVLAKKPGWKDSNFQVMKAKFAVVASLAEKANVFGKRSTACVLPGLVEKVADVKVKPQCIVTLMLITERMTLNYISLQAMKHAFDQKNPKVQSETLDWLGQAVKDFGFLLNMKPLIEYIKKAFTATNPAVRTAAINLLGTIHMYIGGQLRVFFEDEKPALLQQIDAAFEKTSGESPPAPTRGPNVRGEEEEEEGGDEGEGGGAAPAAAVSLADLMPKVDISGQLKSELIRELGDKNWKIRGEALQKVQGIISTAKFISPSLGELPAALKGRLGDSNKNLVTTTLNIVASLATAMGSSCSKYCRAFIPGILGTLADSKVQVRQAAIACLNTWYTEVTIIPFVEQEFISGALANENPHLRTELLGWLEEKLPGAGKLPPEISSLIPVLLSCLEDRSADVRKKGQAVLPLLMVQVGYDAMIKHTNKLKPASKQIVKALLDKHRATAAPQRDKAKPPAVTSTPSQPEKPEKPVEQQAPSSGTKTSEKKGPARPGSTAKSKPGKGKSGGAAAEEVQTPPLILVPNGKEQRMKDEEKMKTLKWNFPMPRTEHIDQLKEQMQPCVSPALYSQLFHDDFKHHITALVTLTKCVSGDAPHKDAAIGSLDVILRWITLRFFETNTTINLKCLELLHALFQMLVADGSYRMNDYEANSLLPYLVQKVGDAKDAVRKGVRSLFRELCSFYPPAKLFSFVLDGVKSKNARQRTECLEELGELIQNNGMTVCGSSPQKTIPLIAAQITDRDNVVRSAALNTMVIVYGNVGEVVFKYTNQLSEKEISLLEERIRRYGKKPPSAMPTPQQPGPSPQAPEDTPTSELTETLGEKKGTKTVGSRQQGLKPSSSTEALPTSEPPPERTSPPLPAAQPPPPKPEITGPFKIDMQKYLAPRLGSKFTNGGLKLQQVDTSVLHEPVVTLPKFTSSRLLANPPAPVSISPSRMASTSAAINFIISQITSSDTAASSKALRQVEVVVSNPSQRIAVTTHIDQLIRAVLMQMRMNFTTPLAKANDPQSQREVMDLGKKLTSCLVTVFSEPSLASVASQESLIEVEHDIMNYLVDERLLKLEDIAQLIRSFNFLMLRLCENSDKTALFGSLLQVLLKSVNADGSSTKLTEMTMKCLWKITRQLPQLLPSLNIDQLLREVHLFFQGYVKIVPSPTPDDTPYRTVKTILFHLTNTIGAEVMDHLTLIKDVKQSRVTQYVRKTLAKKRLSVEKSSEDVTKTGEGRKSAKSGVQSYKLTGPSPFESLPPGASSTLTGIFKKIAQPQTTREGLLELYRFKQQHPTLDLSSFQRGTSKFYNSYIERGLKSIECEVSATGEGIDTAPLGDSNFEHALTSDEYKDGAKALESIRLRASRLMNIDWDKKAEKPDSTSPAQPTLGSGGGERKPVPDENTPIIVKSDSHIKPPGSTRPAGASLNLDDLRKRLDRLKGST